MYFVQLQEDWDPGVNLRVLEPISIIFQLCDEGGPFSL